MHQALPLLPCYLLSLTLIVFSNDSFNLTRFGMEVDYGRERLSHGLGTLNDRRAIKPGG